MNNVKLEEWNISLNNLFDRRMGVGDNTYFWKDIWFGNMALKDVFPKLYLIENQKKKKNYKVANRVRNSDSDRQYWKRNLEGVLNHYNLMR